MHKGAVLFQRWCVTFYDQETQALEVTFRCYYYVSASPPCVKKKEESSITEHRCAQNTVGVRSVSGACASRV